MEPRQHPYFQLLAPRASPAALSWLERTASGLAADALQLPFARAPRHFPEPAVMLGPEERQRCIDAEVPSPAGWALSSVARSLLLQIAVRSASGDPPVTDVSQLFARGDSLEREVILRSLSALPMPGSYVPIAAEACRSHVQSVFEAIACENPFPARHLPDLYFNQLVMKAFFTEVEVKRIEGLTGRRTPELVQMALDFASERRAAGRPVPPDLHLVTGSTN